MNFKRILSLCLIISFLFLVVTESVGAENFTSNKQLDKYSINFDGQEIVFTESIDYSNNTGVIDLDWDNGKKEQIFYKENKDGLVSAEVVANGRTDYVKTDEKGNVYV